MARVEVLAGGTPLPIAFALIPPVPSPGAVFALIPGEWIDTGSCGPLSVVKRDAFEVVLTGDGRSYRRGGWHEGPELGEPVYVEVWGVVGRTFHGWIDSVSRKLVQAG